MEERSIQDEDGDEKSIISVRTKKYRAADKARHRRCCAHGEPVQGRHQQRRRRGCGRLRAVLGQVIGQRSGIGGLIAALPAPEPSAPASQV